MPLSDDKPGSPVAKQLFTMQPGTGFVYWSGLPDDALQCGDQRPPVFADARHLYDLGYAELVQKRHGPSLDYWIIRRRNRNWDRYDEWKRQKASADMGVRSQYHARRS